MNRRADAPTGLTRFYAQDPATKDSASLLRRWTSAAACVPQSEYLYALRSSAVVEMVVNAGQMKSPDIFKASVKRAGTQPRLKRQKRKRAIQFLLDGIRRGGTMQCPPSRHLLYLGSGAMGNSNRKWRGQAGRRRRSRSCSDEMLSPHSISAMALKSSASCSGEATNVSSSSRARIVTTAPSAKESPLRMTLPPTTVPVAIFIIEILLLSLDA